MNDRDVKELVELFREIVRDELRDRDSTILCQIKAIKDNEHYDVSIVPDDSSYLRNVANMTRFNLEVGDYVYVYKINNQLNNCFICYKVV